MPEFYLFGFCLFVGWLLRNIFSNILKKKLKHTTYIILLIFVVASLWRYGLPNKAFLLLLIGGLLQFIPTICAIFFENRSLQKSFLIFGTYGGGSRGMLALSIISPILLPVFIIIDLGNFLSLIFFYPLLVKIGLQKNNDRELHKISFQPLLISFLVIFIGLMLNHFVNTAGISGVYYLLKLLLIGLTSFQIGVHLRLNYKCMLWTIKSMIVVRFVALLIPFLLIQFLPQYMIKNAIFVLFIFLILPVSSIAISLLPDDVESSFKNDLSCAVTASSLLFILMLGSAYYTTKFFSAL